MGERCLPTVAGSNTADLKLSHVSSLPCLLNTEMLGCLATALDSIVPIGYLADSDDSHEYYHYREGLSLSAFYDGDTIFPSSR